jgi:hypothetical protein
MISNVIEANMKKVEWKSEANQDIEAFTEVVRNQDYVFSKVPLDAITELQKTIASIETEPPEVVAEAIRQWYLDYEDVRDAVVLEIYGVRVPRTKPENEENTVKNRYQPLQKELEKLKEKKTPTLKLAKLIAEKDPNPYKKVTIYPLTKEGKLITEITPFTISADTSSDTVARMLRKKGITTGNWYGADEGENLPSKYL